LRFLRKTSGNERRVRVFKFSLLLVTLLVAAFGGAQSLSDTERAVAGKPLKRQIEILSRSTDDSIRDQAVDILRGGRIDPQNGDVQDLLGELKTRAAIERRLPRTSPDAMANKAKDIKNNPAFSDRAPKKTSSWLAKALENLAKLFNPPQRRAAPNMNMPRFNLNWLVPVMWGILGGIVLVLIALIIRHFRWQGRLRRKVTALLDDDEPERTLDEWLVLADELQAKGDFRGAVRALYLASLMRLDEANIIRFNRRETNWEHYSRLEKSPMRPESLDFLSPTQHFDRVWYGQIVRGSIDAQEMRQVYLQIVAIVSQVKAA
jgi:hypothetical protein